MGCSASASSDVKVSTVPTDPSHKKHHSNTALVVTDLEQSENQESNDPWNTDQDCLNIEGALSDQNNKPKGVCVSLYSDRSDRGLRQEIESQGVDTTINMFSASSAKSIAQSEESLENPDNVKNDDVKDKSDETEGEKGTGSGEETKLKEKKAPKTKEEVEQFKEKTVTFLRTTAAECSGLEDQLEENQVHFHVKIRNGLLRFCQSYFGLKNCDSLEEIKKYRFDLAELLVDSKFLDICCHVLIHTYPIGIRLDTGKRDDKKYLPLQNALLTMLNFSDASDKVAMALPKYPGFLEMLAKVLKELYPRLMRDENDETIPKLSESEEKIMKWCLSIAHNMSMKESNISIMREHNFTQIIQPYLNSKLQSYRINALATLAGIVNEEESEIINKNEEEVAGMLSILRKGLEENLRRYKGWSCQELSLTVRQLARNDANLKLLDKLGAMELLVKVGQTGDQAEQFESVSAIWALLFDKEVKEKVIKERNKELIHLLNTLKDSENHRIRHAAEGALWLVPEAEDILDQETVEGEKEQSHGRNRKSSMKPNKKKKKSTGSGTKDLGHVFISYQWGDQEILKRVRDSLKEQGYEVWMDIYQMGGSTLQAMAEAVENAAVVLICMSQKYKNSSNCRSEAEYAFQKGKKIVPLKMERGYQPDGWLGFIVGAKLYFEFSWKYPFETKMPALLREISILLKGKADDIEAGIVAESAPTSSSQPPSSKTNDNIDGHTQQVPSSVVAKVAVPMATVAKVRKWNTEEVKKWIDKNSLEGCVPGTITGDEIALLICMRVECPEFFYKTLNDILQVHSLLRMAKLVWALQDIGTEQ